MFYTLIKHGFLTSQIVHRVLSLLSIPVKYPVTEITESSKAATTTTKKCTLTLHLVEWFL